jgi:hypothetical protein
VIGSSVRYRSTSGLPPHHRAVWRNRVRARYRRPHPPHPRLIIDLAEDLVQEALVAALEQWPQSGVPDPAAWLTASSGLVRRSPPATPTQTGSGQKARSSAVKGSHAWWRGLGFAGTSVYTSNRASFLLGPAKSTNNRSGIGTRKMELEMWRRVRAWQTIAE